MDKIIYWYEIFIDFGEEIGTRTVETCDTLKEARKVKKQYIKQGHKTYIDKWKDIDNPTIIKEIK